MRRASFVCCAVILAACSRLGNGALPFSAPAETAVQPDYGYGYHTIHTFGGSDGAYPEGNLIVAKGELYSTTAGGGANNDGTVFAMKTSGSLQVRHSFDGSDGDKPSAGLLYYFGLFYGTTNGGGTYKAGTIYVMDHSGDLQTLHQFGRGKDGEHPVSTLLPVGKLLYGTTNYGGSDGKGTVFSLTPAGRERVIHSFSFVLYGDRPDASLTRVGDKMYGVTYIGGNYRGGTVFSMTTGGLLHSMHSFGRNFDGKHPQDAALLYFDGELYGTTCYGGTQGRGTVFRISLTGKERVIYNFGDAPHDGRCPSAGLTAVRGELYGTTEFGGRANFGTVFKVDKFGLERVMHSFAGGSSDGTEPVAALTYYQGLLYGTASFGGGSGLGTAFSILP